MHPPPEFATHENERKGTNFLALDESHGFKQFIESAETAGHDDIGARIFDQHDLAGEEVVEIEALVDVGIRSLFVRKINIESVTGAP